MDDRIVLHLYKIFMTDEVMDRRGVFIVLT